MCVCVCIHKYIFILIDIHAHITYTHQPPYPRNTSNAIAASKKEKARHPSLTFLSRSIQSQYSWKTRRPSVRGHDCKHVSCAVHEHNIQGISLLIYGDFLHIYKALSNVLADKNRKREEKKKKMEGKCR